VIDTIWLTVIEGSLTLYLFLKGVFMENVFRVLGVIASIAVIGFSFAACDNGSGPGTTYSIDGIK